MYFLDSLCVVVVVVQLVYLIGFRIAFEKVSPPQSSRTPPVSVVVCAHDEEANLRQLIPLLLKQEYPEFEVIIVEDRCNDNTFDYLLETIQTDKRLRMVRVAHKPEHISGKKFALTLGIKAAHFDTLLFTDADCRPFGSQWIASMAAAYDERVEMVLGFSPYQQQPGFLNSFIRFESLLTAIQYIGAALLGNPYMGVGRNLSYKKTFFLANKGFHTHQEVMGGDDDLFINAHAMKQNTRVCVGKEAMMISLPKLTWKDFFQQKLRHLSVGTRYRFADALMIGLFMSTSVATWLFVVPALFWVTWPLVMVGLVVLRWIVQMSLFAMAAKKMGTTWEIAKTPFLDIIFSFYYLVTGLRALVIKRIRWKN